MSYRSPLGKHYKSPSNQAEVKKKCQHAVKEHRLLLWPYEACNDDWERQIWKNKAKELYGE